MRIKESSSREDMILSIICVSRVCLILLSFNREREKRRAYASSFGNVGSGTTPFAKRNERARARVCACFYKDLSTARCKPREMLGVTFVITRAEIKGNGAQSSVRTVTVKNGKRFLGRGDDRDGYFSK